MSDLNRYKKEILTIEEFWEERPDLAIHSEQTIQACINSAATILNSICNNLISEVWNYNRPVPNPEEIDDAMGVPDPSSPLYRNEFELNNIKEAFIQQTQYMVNLGNDLTTGAVSGSVGNVNFSSSRNETQDSIAPAVITLLTKARVYKINELIDLSTNRLECDNNGFYGEYDPETIKFLTYSSGDTRYVRQYQPNINKKNMLLTVDPKTKMTYWMDAIELDKNVPEDLIEAVYNNTQRLNYVQIELNGNKDLINNNIDSINQLESKLNDTGNVIENITNAINEINVNLDTTNSNVDINKQNIETINQAQTEQADKLNSLSDNVSKINDFFKDGNIIRFRGVWDETTSYAEYDYVLYNNKTYFAIKPSIDIEPGTNPDYWAEQEISQDIDLENYYKKVDNLIIDNNAAPQIKIGTNNQVKLTEYGVMSKADNVRTISYVKNDSLGVIDTTNLPSFDIDSNHTNYGSNYVNISNIAGSMTLRAQNNLNAAHLTGRSLRFARVDEAANDGYGEILGIRDLDSSSFDHQVPNKKYVDNYYFELLDKINDLESEIIELKKVIGTPTYYFRVSYSGANITFRFCDQAGKDITTESMGVRWNFQNGYTDRGDGFNSKNNEVKTAQNTSTLTISYPARNDYYAAYEYILCLIEARVNNMTYYSTFENFWTPHNGRAQIPGKTVCFNLPALPYAK